MIARLYFFLFDSPGIVNSSTSSMSPWIIRCCTRFITSYVTRNQALRRVIFVFYIRKGTITASDRRWSSRSCRVSFDFLSFPLTIPTNLSASSIFGHVETTILLWNRCEFSRPITFPLRIRISFFSTLFIASSQLEYWRESNAMKWSTGSISDCRKKLLSSYFTSFNYVLLFPFSFRSLFPIHCLVVQSFTPMKCRALIKNSAKQSAEAMHRFSCHSKRCF